MQEESNGYIVIPPRGLHNLRKHKIKPFILSGRWSPGPEAGRRAGAAPLQPQGRGIMRQMPHGSFALNASLCTPLTLSNRLLITNEDVLKTPVGAGPFYFAPYHKYLIKLAFFLKTRFTSIHPVARRKLY